MIHIENLTKRYGGFTAVDDISFDVRPGHVVGFLGPNGAGKSTTLRMVTGLTPPTAGEAEVLGSPYRSLPNPGRRVGVMLDASAQHPGRTGREVLRVAAIHMGLPRRRVDEVLDTVGLTPDEAGRRVRAYSLGMRQRLGLAVALLGDPEVLVLDEPANGLDPQGIHWMRGLLRGFADEGGTVLLSSHLLHEVQIIADEIVMIGQGRIVAQGSTVSMLAQGRANVSSLDNATLAAALSEAGHEVASTSAGLLVAADTTTIGQVALRAGVVLTGLRAGDAAGLEETYLRLTSGTDRQESAA